MLTLRASTVTATVKVSIRFEGDPGLPTVLVHRAVEYSRKVARTRVADSDGRGFGCPGQVNGDALYNQAVPGGVAVASGVGRAGSARPPPSSSSSCSRGSSDVIQLRKIAFPERAGRGSPVSTDARSHDTAEEKAAHAGMCGAWRRRAGMTGALPRSARPPVRPAETAAKRRTISSKHGIAHQERACLHTGVMVHKPL